MESSIIKVIMYIFMTMGIFYLVRNCFFPDLSIIIVSILVLVIMVLIGVIVEKIKAT